MDNDTQRADAVVDSEATARAPARVRVQGTGGNEGSVLVCDLLSHTGAKATVGLLGKFVGFSVVDGIPCRVPKAWGTGGGWRLDVESLPEIPEPTVEEMASMRSHDLPVAQLQMVYGHLSGQMTSSTTRSYLCCMIAQAKAGTLPTGSGRRVRGTGEPMRVLPVAMPVSTVEALDAAWKRQGFKNRISFIRVALVEKLRGLAEDEVAGLLEG